MDDNTTAVLMLAVFLLFVLGLVAIAVWWARGGGGNG